MKDYYEKNVKDWGVWDCSLYYPVGSVVTYNGRKCLAYGTNNIPIPVTGNVKTKEDLISYAEKVFGAE